MFIRHSASAPPSAAAFAISERFGTFGVSFGIIGFFTACFTAAVISFTRFLSCPIAIP